MGRNECVRFGGHLDIEVSYPLQERVEKDHGKIGQTSAG
jgi:hypothetical protein